MTARKLVLAALVFLPACQNCESCNDDQEASKEQSGLAASPRGGPDPADSTSTRHLRTPPFHRRRHPEAGPASSVASDASIE